MKLKFLLFLTAFLSQVVFAAAQMPNAFSTNDIFSIQNNKRISANSLNSYRNANGNGDFARKQSFPAFNNLLSLNKSSNCDDTDIVFSPTAAPCNGVSVTSITFSNANRTVVSGTDNTIGVIYKYANAGTAPDGTVIDAIVRVAGYSNSQDADLIYSSADVPGSTAGFDQNLQPNLQVGNFTTAAPWNGNIQYEITFYVAGTYGTANPVTKVLTVAATSIDNDGSNACGGLKETVTYSAGNNQILINTPGNTTQVISSNSVTPVDNTIQNGIGTGNNYANAALFVNVSQLTWTYSFASTGNCAVGGASEVRYGSLNMNCQITFDRNFASTTLSGNVYNDTNGLTDSTVNGSGTGTPGGTQVYANLLDGNGFVVSSVAVAANGTYTFPVVVTGSYTIQLSTNQGVESSAAPVKALPNNWVNTGEFIGTGAGNDGAANGLLPVTVASTAITNANFGIEQRPTANNNTATSQGNPGGTTNVTVPATVFSGSDPVSNTISNIRITAFPSNATSITINGTNYTSANFPSGGVIVPTNASGNPTQAILVDPVDGAVTVAIQYVVIDQAGVESASAATASVPFVPVAISGNVLNDTNGLNGTPVNTVDGSGTNAGGPLYANLLNSGGNVLQSVLVSPSGAYTFSGLTTGNYTVQISTNQGTIGNPAPATTLPAGWANVGEHVGTGAGNDGTADGRLAVTIAAVPADVSNANFGIEQRPTANNNSLVSQSNPGGTNSVTVDPTVFSATDPATSTVSSIRITSFPTNATSFTVGTNRYYANAGLINTALCTLEGVTCAAFPAGGVTIATAANGNPTPTVQVDPSTNGTTTVVFTYVAVDQAGVESASAATALVPFNLGPTAADGEISGSLYFGRQPVRNALVVLTDTTSGARTVVRTNNNGEYQFGGKESGRTYIVQPLSSKYAFSPSTRVVNLLDSATGQNFSTAAKAYHPKNDFDGDGKTDIGVFRPAEGTWYVLKSSDDQMSVFHFGQSGDVPATGDFDGDGRADYAVFRPSDGIWYIWQSATKELRAEQFGQTGDKVVPADFDGDGKTDIAVYRAGVWYIRRSSDNEIETRNYGVSDDTPVIGDFNGDRKADFSVYRPSAGTWFTLYNSDENSSARKFGIETDVSVAEDFDGDGMTDIAQFRNGSWFILNSTTDFEATQFGWNSDKLVVGDYDGDGRADISVFRDGLWFIRNSDNGTVRYVDFGSADDVPLK